MHNNLHIIAFVFLLRIVTYSLVSLVKLANTLSGKETIKVEDMYLNK